LPLRINQISLCSRQQEHGCKILRHRELPEPALVVKISVFKA
jgi:hypothetical protein